MDDPQIQKEMADIFPGHKKGADYRLPTEADESSVFNNEFAAMTDTRTGKVLKTIAIGKSPDGAAFDNDLFYSSNENDTLTIISSKNFEVLQNLETQKGTRTMVIDPKNHNVYLVGSRYEFLEPKSLNKYPKILAGSVEILVVKSK